MYSLGCTGVQISIDGDRSGQNRFRKYRNGTSSYDDVIKGILIFLKNKIEVNLRVNLTYDSVSEVTNLLCDLERIGVKKDISIVFVPIDDTNTYSSDESQTSTRYLEELRLLYRKATLKGFKTQIPSHSGSCETCAPAKGQLGKEGIVLSADGSLYSCWDSAGQPDKVVGDIENGYKHGTGHPRWVACGYQKQELISGQSDIVMAACITGMAEAGAFDA